MPIPDPKIATGADRRIRAAAAHRGITIDELSALLVEHHPEVSGTKRTQLHVMIRQATPRLDQLEAIADVTGMPLWYLVAGVDGLDIGHEPRALDTVPSETLAEVRELRQVVDRLADSLNTNNGENDA